MAKMMGRVRFDAADSMPGQLDAKPTFNSLTFKLLFTNPNPNPNPNPNQLPGIELAASSWRHRVGPFPR